MPYKDPRINFGLALLLPFLAWGLQTPLWEFVSPFATFFFYPAVFLSSWLGGRRGGLLATLISLALIGYFFVEPVHTFNVFGQNDRLQLLMFMLLGVTFALTLGHIEAAADRQRVTEVRLLTLFEQAPLGVAVIDSLNGHIYEINPRFAEMVGRSREEMTRIDWMAITHPDDVQGDLDQMARLNAGDISGFQMDKRYLKPDGTVVWIHMTIAPLTVAPGEARRHFCLVEDITERRAAEQRLALADERLRLANDVANIGVWDWDLQNNRLEWDERMSKWYGLTGEERQAGCAYERWWSSVHPDDVESAEARLQEALRTGHYDDSFRICRPDGSQRTIHAAGIVLYDDQHQPERMVSINQDITQQQEQLTALTQARAQLERVASEIKLSAMLDQSLIGIAELDVDGRLTRVNDCFAGMLGYTREELQGQTVQDITDPRDWADTEAHLHTLRQHGQSFMQEKRYRRKSGAFVWGKVLAMPVVDPQTQATGVLAVIIDIDAAKQAEQSLRLALEASQIGMYDWDIVNGHILWTPEHERHWGYRPGEFDGSYQGFAHRVHPDDLAEVNATIEAAKTARQPYRHAFRVVWPDGSVHWMNVRGEFEYDSAGHALHMRGTVLDITDSVIREAELREQKDRLDEAQRIARIGNWEHTLDGHITWSPEVYRQLGVERGIFKPTKAALVGLIHPEDRASLRDWLSQLRGGLRPEPLTLRRYRPDGRLCYLRLQGELQHDSQGQPVRKVGTLQDVTEIQQATELLRQSRQQLTLAMEAGGLGACHLDLASNRIQGINLFRPFFGLPEEPAYDYGTLMERVHPDDRARVDGALQRAITAGVEFAEEYRILHPDGTLIWVTNRAQIMISADGRIRSLDGILVDITKRKLAEAQLRQSESRLLLATDSGQIGTWYWDIVNDTIDLSARGEQHLAKSPGIPFTFPYFLSVLHPDDRDTTQQTVQAALRDHHDYTCAYRVVQPDGGYRWIQAAGHAIYDEAGSPIGMMGVTQDITERRAMEDQILTLNADLEQKVEQRTQQLAAANAAKSQFLASMSHEIRTPMNAVLGLAQLLEDEPLTEDQLQMVQRINSAGRSLLAIINDILDFSKIEAGQLSFDLQPFKLAELLAHIDSMMRAVARGKGLTLNLQEVGPVPGRLSGDALRIEQVLMNLVGNALKFTEQGGVTIRAAPVTVTESNARLRFEIQDTGIGLSPEAVAKLFTPFTQADSGITRRFGGTGLGLSISKRLVELMGGEIGVESSPGTGSTFWFELPFERLADEEKTAAGAAEVKGPRLQGLRLLVVDDSQLNRYLAERVLQREGAEVTLMNDGQQALDCLRANPQGFDLVLMDIMMPVMDGLAATRAIREEPQLKQLPVIALTAGVLAEEKQSALDAGVNDFLPKPMDMDLMASMIRSYCPASA
jgi:PAS domain S-box-containing protein